MKPSVQPISLDLVLVGGGHAHVEVLKRFGMGPVPGTRITLIAGRIETPYSGMLPGYLAGHYSLPESHIDLRPLCRFADARLYHTVAIGLDLEQRSVICRDRPPVPFDLLSIDVGSTPNRTGIEGADEHAIPVKPIDRFLERWREVEERLASHAGTFNIVVIGGGAGGVELSLSLQHRLSRATPRRGAAGARASFTVVTDAEEPLATHARSVQRRMHRVLAGRDIRLLTGHRVVRIEAGLLRCSPGTDVPFDAAVLVTNAAAPAWLAETGLALDASGFLRVDHRLRSISHDTVFAAGDVAAIKGRALPKSGVYAVRQGPVLAENLRRAINGRPLEPYRPQRRTLALISTGDRCAVASYGPLAIEGAWVWRAKDWIDRRWMRRYQQLPTMAEEPAGEDGGRHPAAMRCGGCGAKVASQILRRALTRLRLQARPDVLLGLDAPDDAAVVATPPGHVSVQTVDQFRAFLDDPYLFGRITANHCLGDVYAMGAAPQAALAMVTLPYGPAEKLEEDLYQLLAGALQTLDEAGAALVGGHTGEGVELSFGLSVTGTAPPDALLRKGGLRAGDALVLTKPLGTGAIFAADMRGRAAGPSVDAALRRMLQSSGPAARVLAVHGATACTDVTGFGLLGHLAEMLQASGQSATLRLDALPALDGAVKLLADGIVSSLHPSNEAFASSLANESLRDHPAYPLLFDPQTAGGLLAGVPRDRAAACVEELREAGYGEAAVIGGVEPQSAGPVRLI